MEVERIKSKELLKPEHRLPHQTTSFLYKVIDVAERQIAEQLIEIDKLKNEVISKGGNHE